MYFVEDFKTMKECPHCQTRFELHGCYDYELKIGLVICGRCGATTYLNSDKEKVIKNKI